MEICNLSKVTGPHASVRVYLKGETTRPQFAYILFHGRYSNALDILKLVNHLEVSSDSLICAPEANGEMWYPKRFIEPKSENEPYLSSALSVVEEMVRLCEEKYNVPSSRIIMIGFSQGACLLSEYIYKYPKKYHGIAIFSGGLIGTNEEIKIDCLEGDLKHTPIYIGCDEKDTHIPIERVALTAEVLKKQKGDVSINIYRDLGHAIHPEGIKFINSLNKEV